MQKFSRILLLPLLLLWLFVIIAFYYWGHQYATIPVVIALIRALLQLLILGLIWLAAFGLGAWLSRLLRLQYRSLAETVIYSLALGAALLSLLGLGLGFAGLISGTLLWLLILLAGALALFWIFRQSKQKPFPPATKDASLQRIDFFFLFFTGLALFIGLQLALAPPIAWDGLSTHLVLTRQIVQDGFIEASQFTKQPIAGHMLFVWGMALGGETLPQLLSFSQGLIMVTAVALFSRQHFGRRTAILASAILCSVEVFIITAAWPYLDVPVGLYGFLSALALINWQLGLSGSDQTPTESQNPRSWLLLAALFGVMAAHTKINGLFIYPVLGAGVLLALYWNRRAWRRILIDVALALVIALILTVLWTAAENNLTPGGGADVSQIATSTAEVAGEFATSKAGLNKIREYLIVIWEMTIIGQQGGERYDGAISPFFLILIPLLLILPHKPRVIWSLMLAGSIEFLAWLVVPKGYYQSRHLMLAYPIFSILAAYFISRLPEYDRERFSISGFFRIILVLVFALQLLFLFGWLSRFDPGSYLIGVQDRDQYLSRNLNGGTSPGYYRMMQAMNEQLPPESIVGVPWPEPRVYYCQMNCLRYPFPRNASFEAMDEIARQQGLTHILISEKGLEFWLDFTEGNPDQYRSVDRYARALEEFVGRYGELQIAEEESFYLYRLDVE